MISLPDMQWGPSGSLDMLGVRGNEIADELARVGSVLRFLGPQPALGVSRRDI